MNFNNHTIKHQICYICRIAFIIACNLKWHARQLCKFSSTTPLFEIASRHSKLCITHFILSLVQNLQIGQRFAKLIGTEC